jgi:hypothetical protein
MIPSLRTYTDSANRLRVRSNVIDVPSVVYTNSEICGLGENVPILTEYRCEIPWRTYVETIE